MYIVAKEFISKAYSIIFGEIVTPFIPTIVFDDTYYINFKSEMESYIASFLLGYENCNGYMEVRNYCSNQIASTSYAATLEEFYEFMASKKRGELNE